MLIMTAFLPYAVLLWGLLYMICTAEEGFMQQASLILREIEKLKRSRSDVNSLSYNLQLCRYYLQLGVIFQQQDLVSHSGGDLQRKSLRYFDEVLNLSAGLPAVVMLPDGSQTNPLTILVPTYFQRGVLLKMMGRAEDSLSSFDNVLRLYEQRPFFFKHYELSLIYNAIADSYLLQGNLVEAIRSHHQSLSISPCKTEHWYGYVNTIKEFLYKYKQSPPAKLNEEQIKLQIMSIYSILAGSLHLAVKLCHKNSILIHKSAFPIPAQNSNVSIANIAIAPYLMLNHQSFNHYYEKVYRKSKNAYESLLGLRNEISIYAEEEVLSFDTSPDITHYLSSSFDLPAMTYTYSSVEDYQYSSKESDIYYSLSYVYDALGKYHVAYIYLQYANKIEQNLRLERHRVQYIPEEQEIALNNTVMIFQEEFYDGVEIDTRGQEAKESIEVDIGEGLYVSIEPVFIIGMMRSGSTLLESMLDSHSVCIGIGEESIFNAQLKTFRDELVAISSKKSIEGQNPINAIQQAKKNTKDEIIKFRRKLTLLMFEKIKDSIKSIPRSQFNSQGRLIAFVVDKMLFNFRNIGFIHLVYPDSPILHIYRDPMDTLFSIYKHKFDELSLAWSLHWDHILHQYEMYLKHIRHFSSALGGDRITHIRYEDLVHDAKSNIANLIQKKLGLSFEQIVLEFHSINRSVLTHSQSQVRQKLYKSSIGSWRKYSKPLKSVIKKMQSQLKLLRKDGFFSFDKPLRINWKIEYNHKDYE